MYGVILGVNAASLTIIVAAIVYLLLKKSSHGQKILSIVLVCFMTYGFNLLIRTGAESSNSMIIFSKVSVYSVAFICPLLISFTVTYMRRKISRWILGMLFISSGLTIVAASVYVPKGAAWQKLFYSEIIMVCRNSIIYVERDLGILFYINCASLLIGIIYVTVLMRRYYVTAREHDERIKIIGMGVMIYVCAAAYVINELVPSGAFDVFSISAAFISAMIIVMTKKYQLVGITGVARDSIFDAMPNCVFILDEKRILRDLNKSALCKFPDLEEKVGEQLPLRYRFLLENDDGDISFSHNGIHYDRRVVPILEKGQLTGYGIVLKDVTHIHDMLVQQKRLKKDAEAANESKTTFLKGMSHEIRTPMNAIVGYSDLIMNEVMSEEGLKYARSIKNSTNSLLHIVNDLLDFSKIEQGRLELVEDEYSTARLFAEVQDAMEVGVRKKGLKLLFSVDPTMPSILFGDRMRIKQVLVSVIENSVKFTESGSIRVVAEWERFEDTRADVTVIVSDTGIGMMPEELESVFKEFDNASGKRRSGIGGAGLGLTISKSLLEMMGGSITIESEYGVGTSVVINIKQRIINETPVSDASDEEVQDTPTQEVKAFDAPDARILVVDDNIVNLELMQSLLKTFRIIPDVAGGGKESVEMASRNSYELILMDQMMPEMDGVEAMKRIRELNPHYRDLPIVALTANAVVGVKQELLAVGFTDYASKPIPLKALGELLEKYIPGGSLRIEASPAADVVPDPVKAELPAYIDVKTGMFNCGNDEEQYRNLVSIVHNYADEKIANLNDLFSKKDYENYTIEVHALKGNAAAVGAMQLSGKARELEMAGHEGRYEVIDAGHADFVRDYSAFAEDLGGWLGVGSIQPSALSETQSDADETEFLNSLKEISLCIKDRRFDDAADLFGVFDMFVIPPVLKHHIGDMQEMVRKHDWGSVSDRIDQIFER